MDEDVIIRALEQACQGLDLYFQTIYQQNTLYVYINRQPEQELDYETLAATVQEAIAALELPEVHWIMLFSRVFGGMDLDWQTPAIPILKPDITHEISADVDGQIAAELGEAAGAIDQTQVTNPEAIRENTDPLIAEFAASVPTTDPDAASYAVENTPKADDLSQYCFIRNKALVTGNVLPPESTIAALVQAFHGLDDQEKQTLLPRLEQFFKVQSLADEVQNSDAITEFCQQLRSLDGSEIRKLSIWLSRYCYDPQTTLEQIGAVREPVQPSATVETVDTTPSTVDDPLQQYAANTPHQSSRSASSYRASMSARKPRPSNPRLSWQILVIPLLWTTLTLGFIYWSYQANNGTEAVSQVCKNVKDQPEYCRLAVNLVGIDTYRTYSQQTRPSEPGVAEKAVQDCTSKALFNAGLTVRDLMGDDRKNIPSPKIATHEISPGLFVIDANQTNPKAGNATVRTACVYGTVLNRVTDRQQPQLLASEAIPNQWPQERLKKKPYQVQLTNAQSILGIFTLLGTNTLFTAVGLMAVLFLNLGIRIESLNALYLVAFIFGAIDAMISLVPMIGLFGLIRFTAVPVLSLMIASVFIKEMELDFSAGYKVLAMAGAILIGIRFLCNWLLLITIMSVI